MVKPGERHFNMAKSYPNEEKDAWDVKMLLEVGHGTLSVILFEHHSVISKNVGDVYINEGVS